MACSCAATTSGCPRSSACSTIPRCGGGSASRRATMPSSIIRREPWRVITAACSPRSWGMPVLSEGKRVYMAGAGGMLGEAFHHVFGPRHTVKCTDKDVNSDWLGLLDFRDFAAYRDDVRAFAPDYLFHLGAYTDL